MNKFVAYEQLYNFFNFLFRHQRIAYTLGEVTVVEWVQRERWGGGGVVLAGVAMSLGFCCGHACHEVAHMGLSCKWLRFLCCVVYLVSILFLKSIVFFCLFVCLFLVFSHIYFVDYYYLFFVVFLSFFDLFVFWFLFTVYFSFYVFFFYPLSISLFLLFVCLFFSSSMWFKGWWLHLLGRKESAIIAWKRALKACDYYRMPWNAAMVCVCAYVHMCIYLRVYIYACIHMYVCIVNECVYVAYFQIAVSFVNV